LCGLDELGVMVAEEGDCCRALDLSKVSDQLKAIRARKQEIQDNDIGGKCRGQFSKAGRVPREFSLIPATFRDAAHEIAHCGFVIDMKEPRDSVAAMATSWSPALGRKSAGVAGWPLGGRIWGTDTSAALTMPETPVETLTISASK
jgi:hypothetical protein